MYLAVLQTICEREEDVLDAKFVYFSSHLQSLSEVDVLQCKYI